MLTMSVWQACKPLLILIVLGAAVLAAAICYRHRSTEKDGKLPSDTLAEIFQDSEE